MFSNLNLKRIAIILSAVAVLGAIIFLIINYLNTGKIIITSTTPNNTITLVQVDQTGKATGSKVFTGQNQLSATVTSGQYLASVTANSIASTQLIKISGHKTLSFTINPIQTTGVEPVLYTNAKSITADAQQLLYLGGTSGNLYKIDSQNNLTNIDQVHSFQSAQWADSSFGIAQDSNGHLYSINSGQVSPLSVPFSYNDTEVANYSVAGNGQVYIAFDGTVYGGKKGLALKKLYTSSFSSPGLVAGPNQVSITQGGDESGLGPIEAVVDLSGKVVKKSLDTSTQAWSTSGKYLAAAVGSGAAIYDNSLNQITPIPNSTLINQMSWLDDNTLFYSLNDQLWVYKVGDQSSKLIANMPLGEHIIELSLSTDQSYVYITTVGSQGSITLRRVGLHGQTTPSYIYQLQNILPKTLTNYSLGLLNFAKPIILVSPSPNTPTHDFVAAAKAELQADGFDPKLLQFQLLNTANLN